MKEEDYFYSMLIKICDISEVFIKKLQFIHTFDSPKRSFVVIFIWKYISDHKKFQIEKKMATKVVLENYEHPVLADQK